MEKLTIYGEHDPQTIDQIQKIASQEEACYSALCADGHLGYSVPVGGVVAYDGLINVNGVGYDIACGNKAVRLECNVEEVKANIQQIMDKVYSTISFGVGRKNKESVDHPLFHLPIWNEVPLLKGLKDKAIEQLGTVGSGNHYVDIFVDELNRVWIGVHFGSRGLGHNIATHFVDAGGGKDGIHAAPVLFNENSDLGEQYLSCMDLAGQYAYAGRDWVCQKVADILKGRIVEEIHNHHNFAWKENHFGKDYWVVRKGATPAFPSQKGFVGGSMGDISVILEGVETPESTKLLYSTVHGAGRIMGRTAAKGKFNRKTGKRITEGLIKSADHNNWMKAAGVEVRGGDLDESPLAYKRIERVLAYHKPTIKIIHTLKPIGVCMAGDDIFDPYKD